MDAFRPNRTVTGKTVLFISGLQVAALSALWAAYPSTLVPRPQDVLSAWVDMFRNDGMAYELYTSFVTNLQALSISCALSLLFAYSTVLPIARPLVAALSKARFFGMTGFVVLFTVLFGAGHWLKIALLVFGMSTFFITSMAAVVEDIPRSEYDHARTLRMGEWRVVLEIVVLGRIDYAFECLRQNAAMGWMMLTMVEGLSRSEGGIGTMLLNQNKHFHLAAIAALQLTVFVVGVLQDWGINSLKKAACPYSNLTLERR